MKTQKTLKSIIAMALALILSLGIASTAFASNGSITWTVDGETAECTYHSDLAVGTNTIKIEESDYYYFDISELENGYYSAKLSDDVFEYFCTPEKSGNKYVGWGDMKLIGGIEYIIFHRDENVDIAIGGVPGTTDSTTIEIEYLGENIESVEIENEEEFLVDCDFDNYGTNEWAGYFDTKVTFTGGKTFEAEDLRCYFSFAGEPQRGENTINLTFIDYTSEQVISAAYISDYISGVEAEIPEGVAANVYYHYYFDLINTVDEVTVNFTDGTSKTVKPGQTYCPLTLPNGREIKLRFEYYLYVPTLTVFFRVYADERYGGTSIGTFELNTEKASFSDNVEHFKQNVILDFERIDYYIDNITEYIAEGEIQAAMFQVRYLFNSIGYCIENVFYEIGLLANFMLI